MIVGFDNDDPTVFDAQRRFIGESRIALAMINILNALPRTPLFARLDKAGRLKNSGEAENFGVITANFIPAQISRKALCDGYLDLMRDLYSADAYFDRLDALFLDAKLMQNAGRRRYLRRHPWRWLKRGVWSTIEALHVFVQLMRLVPDPELRREYRQRLWNVVKRRPRLSTLRAYCIKCALHYHYDRLITQMRINRATLGPEIDDLLEAIPAAAE